MTKSFFFLIKRTNAPGHQRASRVLRIKAKRVCGPALFSFPASITIKCNQLTVSALATTKTLNNNLFQTSDKGEPYNYIVYVFEGPLIIRTFYFESKKSRNCAVFESPTTRDRTTNICFLKKNNVTTYFLVFYQLQRLNSPAIASPPAHGIVKV